MSAQGNKQAILRKRMDGPVVPWTVGDVVKLGGNSLFMTYHVTTTPWALAAPVGCLLGGLYAVITSKISSKTVLGYMSTGGLVLGGMGALTGLGLRTKLAWQGETATTLNGIPWTEAGIQQRVDGLSHNFKVRMLDLSTWNGALAVVCGLAAAGVTPVSLGLAPGALGVVQTITLGSSLGSVAGLSCIYWSAKND